MTTMTFLPALRLRLLVIALVLCSAQCVGTWSHTSKALRIAIDRDASSLNSATQRTVRVAVASSSAVAITVVRTATLMLKGL